MARRPAQWLPAGGPEAWEALRPGAIVMAQPEEVWPGREAVLARQRVAVLVAHRLVAVESKGRLPEPQQEAVPVVRQVPRPAVSPAVLRPAGFVEAVLPAPAADPAALRAAEQQAGPLVAVARDAQQEVAAARDAQQEVAAVRAAQLVAEAERVARPVEAEVVEAGRAAQLVAAVAEEPDAQQAVVEGAARASLPVEAVVRASPEARAVFSARLDLRPARLAQGE